MHICHSLRRIVIPALVTWMVSTSAQSGGKAGEEAIVSFHIETEHAENPNMVFPIEAGGKTRYFRRMPEIAAKDIAAFRPFPGDDGANTYGIVFQLKKAAARRLANISNANQGRMLLAMTSGRPVDMVMIDQQVDDGFIVIWKGITEAEIRLYDQAVPRIGDDKKKRR
ncbi:MAG: hypothetical protein ACNA8L_09830 [Luteolibacter sp.]|jgi:hypothetical protein